MIKFADCKGGFPHSEMFGSKGARASPNLIAACHVLHRLSTPRHPSEALMRLIVLSKTHALGGEAHACALVCICQTMMSSQDPPFQLHVEDLGRCSGAGLTLHSRCQTRRARTPDGNLMFS